MTQTSEREKVRVALVTGAGSGLGEATAEKLAEAGFRLALVDIDQARVAAVAERLPGAETYAVDVSQADAVERLFDEVAASRGRLDYVVHSAGILGPLALIEEASVAEVERLLNVNLKGSFLVLRNAVRVMKETGGGAVTLVASIAAGKGSALYPVYSATKAGVIAMAKSVARNAGRFNVRVNTVSPGSILGTRLADALLGGPAGQQRRLAQAVGLMKTIPVGRAAQSRDVANVIRFLASPEAAHVHGVDLTIDGGENLGFEAGLANDVGALFGVATDKSSKVA